jgi:hypothetical protein
MKKEGAVKSKKVFKLRWQVVGPTVPRMKIDEPQMKEGERSTYKAYWMDRKMENMMKLMMRMSWRHVAEGLKVPNLKICKLTGI